MKMTLLAKVVCFSPVQLAGDLKGVSRFYSFKEPEARASITSSSLCSLLLITACNSPPQVRPSLSHILSSLKHSQIHLKSTRPMPRLFSWICSQHILAPLDPAFILMQVLWRVILRGHLWQKVLQHFGCKRLKLVAELKIWVVGRPWVLCLPSTFFWEFIELLK